MSNDVWKDNSIQFARLLAEIQADVLFSRAQEITLLASMDIKDWHLQQLFGRAQKTFERNKKFICPAPNDKPAKALAAALKEKIQELDNLIEFANKLEPKSWTKKDLEDLRFVEDQMGAQHTDIRTLIEDAEEA